MQKRHLLGSQRNRGCGWNRSFPGSPGSRDTPGRHAAIALWILTNFTGVLQISHSLGPSSQRPRAGSGNSLQIKSVLIMPFFCMISYVAEFNQLFFILHCCFLLHHLTFCISLHHSPSFCFPLHSCCKTFQHKCHNNNKNPSISLVSGRMQELNIRPAYCNTNWFEPSWKPISNKDLLAFLPLCMTAVKDSIKTHILKHSVENNIQSKSNGWWFKVHPGSRRLGSGLGTPASAEKLPGCRWESSWVEDDANWSVAIRNSLWMRKRRMSSCLSPAGMPVIRDAKWSHRACVRGFRCYHWQGTPVSRSEARNQILLGETEGRESKPFVELVLSVGSHQTRELFLL